MAKHKLKWGETPWDHLSREDLIREVQRFYSAAIAAQTALKLSSMNDPHSPYWATTNGTGGMALAKIDMALDRSEAAKFDSEDLYRSFFRYAADLLFTSELGFGWWICDKCGTMLGAPAEGQQRTQKCIDCKTEQLRPITWDDLKPRRS